MKLQELHDHIPSPVNWAVILQGPIVGFFNVLNPILQAVAYTVTIVWGLLQIYGWYKRSHK